MTTSFGNSLAPLHMPGSYLERITTALDLIEQGELDQAAVIVVRVMDRISRLPERKRSKESDLGRIHQTAGNMLIDIRAKQGQWDAVDSLCQRMAQDTPDRAFPWLRRAWDLRIDHGITAKGLAGLRSMGEQRPDDFDAWGHLAERAIEVEAYDLAELALRRCEELASGWEDAAAVANMHLVRFYLRWRQQRWEAASQAWEKAVEHDADIVETKSVVVQMFIEAGMLDHALRYVDDEALSKPLADYYRAWIANLRGDHVRARYLWRTIVEIEPEEMELDIAIIQAGSYCWLRQPEVALPLLLDHMALTQDVSLLQAIVLALAWAMVGDARAAHANLKLARQRNGSKGFPDRPLAYMHWIVFDQLLEDDAIKAELRPYFEAPR